MRTVVRHPELRHHAPLTWQSRDAPSNAFSAHATTWRERAVQHREKLAIPVHIGSAGGGVGEARPLSSRTGGCGTAVAEDKCTSTNTSRELPRPASGMSSSTADSRVLAEPPPARGHEEDLDGDWWGSLMRIDVARYAVFKNAQLRAETSEGNPSEVAFEHSGVWSVVGDIVGFEHSSMRRSVRSMAWPDTMWSPQHLPTEHTLELREKLVSWIDSLEKLGGDNNRTVLKRLPVDVLLHQLLSDMHASAGDWASASRVLLQGVEGRSSEDGKHGGEDPHFAPLLLAWEDQFDCGYIKAQQSVRFGRLALAAAEGLQVGTGSNGDGAARMQQTVLPCRVAAIRERKQTMIAKARRHLVDARRLYEEELDHLEKGISSKRLGSGLWAQQEADEWKRVLRCGLTGTFALLSTALSLSGREADAAAAISKALKEVRVLQGDPGSTPQLLRLISTERLRLEELTRQLQH